MPGARLELACPFGRHPLKMVCLPVPPSGQKNVSVGGLEPPTLCLKGRCSTPELHARTFWYPCLRHKTYSHYSEHVLLTSIDYNIQNRAPKFNANFLSVYPQVGVTTSVCGTFTKKNTNRYHYAVTEHQ